MSETEAMSLPGEAELIDDEKRNAALRRCAEELAARPGDYDAWLARLGESAAGEDQEANLRTYFIAGLLVKAAGSLPVESRREIAQRVVELMEDAADVDADFDLEVFENVLGSMGPAVLPELIAGLQRDPRGEGAWFYLWGAMETVLETDDRKLRDMALGFAMQTLIKTDQGKMEIGTGFVAAYLVARLGHRDAYRLIARLYKEDSNVRADLEYALDLLDGRKVEEMPEPRWREPVEEWVGKYCKKCVEWGDEPEGEDQMEDDGELDEVE